MPCRAAFETKWLVAVTNAKGNADSKKYGQSGETNRADS